MKVLFVQTSNSGIAYWRMFNYAKAISRMELGSAQVLWWQKDLNETHPWEVEVSDPIYRARILSEMNAYVREADVVVFQMIHTMAALDVFYSVKEAYPDKCVCVEIDDNIISTPEYNPAAPFYDPNSGFRKLAVEQMKAADAVICSTPYLAELYTEFNAHCVVVQNAIDVDVWAKAARLRKRKGGIRIGWAGGASHNDDLDIIRPAVDAILKRHSDVSFVFVHGVPEFFKGKERVEAVLEWAPIYRYPDLIARQDFDIGMAPLVDNAFNRGKSNLRWLEYSALGIPTVASNVGHFASTIKNGEDGLLCDTPEDFLNNLDFLVRNRKERKKIGNAARSRVYSEFSADAVAKHYLKVLGDIIERGPCGKVPPAPEIPVKSYQMVGQELTDEEAGDQGAAITLGTTQ